MSVVVALLKAKQERRKLQKYLVHERGFGFFCGPSRLQAMDMDGDPCGCEHYDDVSAQGSMHLYCFLTSKQTAPGLL